MYVYMYVCVHVCVCTCMCVYMYVCVHVCVCTCMCVYMYVCVHVCVCTCMCVYMYVCVHVCVCTCMCVYMYVCVHVCVCTCMCVYMYVCVHVCVCTCMCVYMYVCVHVCVCTCMCVYMYVCVHVCVCTCMCVYMYVCVHVCMCTCMCVYMYVCVHVCVCTCMCVYMYVCVHVCVCTCMYVYMYVCVHVCVCMCMYVYMYVCMCTCMYSIHHQHTCIIVMEYIIQTLLRGAHVNTAGYAIFRYYSHLACGEKEINSQHQQEMSRNNLNLPLPKKQKVESMTAPNTQTNTPFASLDETTTKASHRLTKTSETMTTCDWEEPNEDPWSLATDQESEDFWGASEVVNKNIECALSNKSDILDSVACAEDPCSDHENLGRHPIIITRPKDRDGECSPHSSGSSREKVIAISKQSPTNHPSSPTPGSIDIQNLDGMQGADATGDVDADVTGDVDADVTGDVDADVTGNSNVISVCDPEQNIDSHNMDDIRDSKHQVADVQSDDDGDIFVVDDTEDSEVGYHGYLCLLSSSLSNCPVRL